jgi:hypothetical protein
MEGAPGHTHGLGVKYVLHERHGMAKARHALGDLNYKVEKVVLMQRTNGLAGCVVLVVAGPKVPLWPWRSRRYATISTAADTPSS